MSTSPDVRRIPRTTYRQLIVIVFWVACGLSTLCLALSWVMAVAVHFGDASYNPLWLSLAVLLLSPSGGLWVAAWLIRNPDGSPRR